LEVEELRSIRRINKLLNSLCLETIMLKICNKKVSPDNNSINEIVQFIISTNSIKIIKDLLIILSIDIKRMICDKLIWKTFDIEITKLIIPYISISSLHYTYTIIQNEQLLMLYIKYGLSPILALQQAIKIKVSDSIYKTILSYTKYLFNENIETLNTKELMALINDKWKIQL